MDQASAYEAATTAFYGYAIERETKLEERSLGLTHYTTAANAIEILDSQQLWLRSATVMNDHTEGEYGRQVMHSELFGSAAGERFWSIIERNHDGLGERLKKRHLSGYQNTREATFMAALSEHRDVDRLGRLSMWRAYGGPVAGVALVFDRRLLTLRSPKLNLNVSPVLYGGEKTFARQLTLLNGRLWKCREALASLPADVVEELAGAALHFSTLSIKHPGFAEEREWRLLHIPVLLGGWANEAGEIATIRGVPQIVVKAPLHVDAADMHPVMDGYNLDRLLTKILIGPCLYPENVRAAFVEKLRQIGVSNPTERIIVSDIPLRQYG